MEVEELRRQNQQLEYGLAMALQIIVNLGQELSQKQPKRPKSGKKTKRNKSQNSDLNLDSESQKRRKNDHSHLLNQIDELTSVDSLCDLLKFIREDKKNLLVRNSRVQKVVQKSFMLLQNNES